MSGYPREAMWRAIRAMQPGWSCDDVSAAAGDVTYNQACGYVDWLERLGLVRRHGPGRYRTTLAGREMLITPTPEGIEKIELSFVRETRTGAVRLVFESNAGAYDRVRAALVGAVELHTWHRQETVRDRLYAALRAMGGQVATAVALAEKAESKESTAYDYLRCLRNAGLIERGPDGWRATAELPEARPQAPETRTIKRKGVQS